MRVISFSNQKGGVSKTTTTQAVANILNSRGRRALCIDFDPQANLSFAMGADTQDSPTVYNMLKGEVNAADILQKTRSGDILPSNIFLSGADTEFTATGREYLLKEAISDISKQYDYVLIDCPPALSILTINAFSASHFIVVPVLADVFSLQGMVQLGNTVKSVKKYCNPVLHVAGILLTRFNQRAVLSSHIKELLESATRNMDTRLFKTCIRTAISIQESQYQRENMLDYDKKGTAMTDYANFVTELEEIVNG